MDPVVNVHTFQTQAMEADLEQVRERVTQLRRWLVSDSAEAQRIADVAVTELETVFEELRITQEELHVQHEALLSATVRERDARVQADATFADSPDPYVATDRHGIVRQANRAAAVLLGVDAPRRLTGKPLANFVVAEDRREFRLRLGHLARGTAESAWRVTLLPRDGAPRPGIADVKVDRDPEGRILLRWLLRALPKPAAHDSLGEQIATVATAWDGICGATVLLADADPPTVAASDPRLSDLVATQLRCGAGPAIDAWHSGLEVLENSLATAGPRRWPALAEQVGQWPVNAVASFPLIGGTAAIGALCVYRAQAGPFLDRVLAAAAALAHGLGTTLRTATELAAVRERAEQLQQALDSRVPIEQAKGALAVKLGMDPEEAFEVLRAQARSSRRKLHDVAAEVLRNTVP